MISPLLSLALTAAMGLSPVVLQETPSRLDASHAREALARAEALIAEAIETPECVGLSVAIALGDEMLLEEGYGLAEVEHEVPANARTMFRIGSITKQFAAAAAVKLAEEGELSLEDDLRDHLPDYPTGEHEVTLRHLLTHTSGIASYTGLGPVWDRTVPLELTDEELVALFSNEPFEFRPGTAWNYSNSGYYLIGMVVDRVTEMPYAEYFHEAFFEPLGLTRTRYGSNVDLIPGRAQGYRVIEGKLANDGLIGMRQPGAAGGLLSTAGDLVRWSLALSGGKVVEPESYEDMTTPFMLEDGRETGYGLGLQIQVMGGEFLCIRHGGGINGFNSELAHYPESGLTLALISNCENYSAGRLAADIARLFLEE